MAVPVSLALRSQWSTGTWEDGIPRVLTETIPNRTARLCALGNSIVPEVVVEILRAIKRIEEEE